MKPESKPGGSGARGGGKVRASILLVEDDPDIVEIVRYNLQKEGYSIRCALTGEDALAQLGEGRCDLIILDLMLPGMDGFEVCRSLKGDPRTADIPVLVLTARTADTDVVASLELGAEDFVTKPFSLNVLLARIRMALRRRAARSPVQSETVRHAGLEIDPSRHTVALDGRPVSLTLTEFRILGALAQEPGRVYSRKELLGQLQGSEVYILDRTIDVHVGSLRKKLGLKAALIETVRGVGYRLADSFPADESRRGAERTT